MVALETALAPELLLSTLQAIENSLGRVRTGKWEPRTIDLDILLYGDQVINASNLVIPHVAMAERRFVLIPLSQLIPDVVHPVSGKTISTMLEKCADTLSVVKVAG